MKTKNNAVAAAASVDVGRWRVERDRLMSRIGARFARRDSFTRARDLVTGLMSDLDRKNCWTIAEHAVHASPDGLQNLLARGSWDHDGVRDDLRDYVVEQLGEDSALRGRMIRRRSTYGCWQHGLPCLNPTSVQ